MESIGYLFAGCISCVISLFVGFAFYFLFSTGFRKIGPKNYRRQYVWVSVPIAVIFTLYIFYRLYAPVFPDYYTPPFQPKKEDLVGIWTATPDTMQLMLEKGFIFLDPPTIEIKANGEFTMTNLPSLIFFERDKKIYSGKGIWTFDRDINRAWIVKTTLFELEPAYYPDPPLSGPTPCPGKSVPCKGLEYTLEIGHRNPPYMLISQIQGLELDPDLYFRRQGDPSN